MIPTPKSRASRLLLALYLIWAYANIYVLLLGGALARGVFYQGGAFYPFTYHGGDGLRLDWTMVREYDCVELYLYVLGPLMAYLIGRLLLVTAHERGTDRGEGTIDKPCEALNATTCDRRPPVSDLPKSQPPQSPDRLRPDQSCLDGL